MLVVVHHHSVNINNNVLKDIVKIRAVMSSSTRKKKKFNFQINAKVSKQNQNIMNYHHKISSTNFTNSTDNRLRFYSSWDREQRQRHHEYENQNSLPQPTTPHRSVNHHNHHRQHQQQQQHRATSSTTTNVHSNYRHYPNSFPVAYWD